MPKTSARITGEQARAAGEPVGLANNGNPIEPLRPAGRNHLPGQLNILAVDPGDRNVGMAMGVAFAHNDPETGEVPKDGQDELLQTHETGRLDGTSAIDVAVNAGWVDVLVVEDWEVYPDKANELVGSRCETARMIGALEHIVRKYNRWSADVEGRAPVELVFQPASIQSHAKDVLRALRVGRTSAVGQPHALSAELHFWFYVLGRRGLLG